MHTQYHDDGMYSIKFKSPVEEADFMEPFQALAKCFHTWEQDYLQPFMKHLTGGVSFNTILLEGDQPIPGQYRCSKCHAIGKYQDLPDSVTYEPVIVRVR